MAQLTESSIDLRQVRRVQFGILSPDEIVRWILSLYCYVHALLLS